jgi:hypothetical protein
MAGDWTSKDPDETDRFGIDWRTQLDGATIESTAWALITPAGVTLSDEEHDDSFVYVVISGGTDGLIAEIQNRVTTSDGRLLEETKRLPIVSSAGAETSGYTVPSVAAFVTRYPRFANVPIEVIQDALAEASDRVDTTWREADYGRAIMFYAAHVLTLDGQGTGTEAQLAGEGLGDFQRIKSGSLDVSRFDRAKGEASSTLSATSFGKRFAELQRLNFAGARIVPGGICRPCNAGATDC